MKRPTTIRLDDNDLSAIDAEAREAGMNRADYIRAIILRRPTQTRSADVQTDAHLEAVEARLARIETLTLASAVSAYEAQLIAIAKLTPEQTEKAKSHRAQQFAVWRQWGVQSAFIGPDMRPKITKEHADE